MTKTRQEDPHVNRPISPHLTIYRKQISSVLSIFHRLTGVMLFFAIAISTWWFILWVFSKFDPYYIQLIKCNLLKVALFFISLAGFYHLCTGIRHLIWDTGKCFSINSINVTGWLAVICAFFFTLIFWWSL